MWPTHIKMSTNVLHKRVVPIIHIEVAGILRVLSIFVLSIDVYFSLLFSYDEHVQLCFFLARGEFKDMNICFILIDYI